MHRRTLREIENYFIKTEESFTNANLKAETEPLITACSSRCYQLHEG